MADTRGRAQRVVDWLTAEAGFGPRKHDRERAAEALEELRALGKAAEVPMLMAARRTESGRPVFSRATIALWQHSEACLKGDVIECICGLTALQGEVASCRTGFVLAPQPYVHSVPVPGIHSGNRRTTDVPNDDRPATESGTPDEASNREVRNS